MLISHLCGHLLRTVCSVSNSLIKINIKQIENIPRRGTLDLLEEIEADEPGLFRDSEPSGTLRGQVAWLSSLAQNPCSPDRCRGRSAEGSTSCFTKEEFLGAFTLFSACPSQWASSWHCPGRAPAVPGAGGRRRSAESQPLAELIRSLLHQTSKLQLTGAGCDPLAQPR